MTSTPMTKSERISALLDITARFVACMEREIELLQAMRPQDIGPLQQDKVALADAYEAQMLALKSAGETDETVSRELQDELTRATERFQAVLAENLRALRAVKTAHDRLLRTIVDAVEQKRGQPAGYTATGATAGTSRSAAATNSVCMAINQQL